MRQLVIASAACAVLAAAAAPAWAAYECDYKRDDNTSWSKASASKSSTDPIQVFSVDADTSVTFRCRHTSADISNGSVSAGYDTSNLGTKTVTADNVKYKWFKLAVGGSVRLNWGNNDIGYVLATDRAIPSGLTDRGDISFTNGVATLSQGGAYTLRGAKTGRIAVTASSTVLIVGKGQAELTTPVDGNASFDADKGAIHSEPNAGKVEVRGVRVVIPNKGMFGIWLRSKDSLITQSAVISGDTVGTLRGRGATETGPGGLISNNVLVPGDDAIRLTANNTSASKNIVHMLGNGNVFQLGWGQKFEGANHTADKTRVFGSIRTHLSHDFKWTEPARAILAGNLPKDGSNVSITGLDIRVKETEAYLKIFTFTCDGEALDRNLCTRDEAIGAVDLNGVVFKGEVRGKPALSFFTGSADNWKYPFTLRALESTQKIRNVDINLVESGTSKLPVSDDGRSYKEAKDATYVTGDVSGKINGWTISANKPPRP